MSLTHKKDYCENCNSILGFECTYVIPKDAHSKGILTTEHWDGNPHNDLPDNLITLCGNCARYKTNLYQDWTTPGRNLKRVEGRSWVEPVDFIYKDWIAHCNQPSFQKVRNEMGIIVGKTGQGKTYSITKYMIPEWKKKPHNIKLVIVSAPQNGILDEIDFYDAAIDNGYMYVKNASEAIDLLERGREVIITTSHQGFTGESFDELLYYAEKNNIEHAIVIDEAHTWLCTGQENYKKVVGWYGSRYNASLYKLLSRISNYNAYIFGLTATPNSEQNGKVKVRDGMTFRIINKNCPVELLLTKQAWWQEFKPLNVNSGDAVYDRIEERIIEIEEEKQKTGVKKTLFIQCHQDGYYGADIGLDVKSVLEHVKFVYKSLGYRGQYKICRMTSDKNEIYTPDGQIKPKLDETKLKRMLNDNNDELTVMLVINKGGMGMNIPTLGGMIFTKSTDKDDGKGVSLTEFARQYMGRLVRPNVLNPKDLKEKFDYDFSKYYKSLSTDSERKNAIQANSFFVDYPDDNTMWETAIDEFKTSYCNSVEFATESLDKM